MEKHEKYTHILMKHTIIFIVISMVLSSISFWSNIEIKTNLVVIFSIILFIYFFAIAIGYAYLLTKYILTRKENGSLITQFKNDNIFRVTIFNALSAIYAFLYAIFSHVMMYYTNSYFYLFVAEIYVVIGLIKIYLVLHVRDFEEKKKKIDVCIITFLFTMAILMFSCAILIYTNKGTFEKNSLLVYAFAFYAFYALISAIISFIKARIKKNQIRQRFFIVKLACALFSMYVLMVSLLNQFSDDDTLFDQFMGGIVFGFVVLLEAMFIIGKKIRNSCLNYEK